MAEQKSYSATKKGPGIQHHTRPKAAARFKPKALRQYSKRYGDGVEAMLQFHVRHPKSFADHDAKTRQRIGA